MYDSTMRRSEHATIILVLDWKSGGPRERWIDIVEKYLADLGVQNLNSIVQELVMVAKTLGDLLRPEKKRRYIYL